jgi:hypothetical protein
MPDNTAKTRGTRTQSRKRCRMCHNLDPLGHIATSYHTDSAKPIAHLYLAVDAFRLSRVEQAGCKFCLLICQALDGTEKEWRRERAPIQLHIVEKGTVTLQIRKPTSEPVLLEIYAQSGMCTFTCGSLLWHNPIFFFCFYLSFWNINILKQLRLSITLAYNRNRLGNTKPQRF